MSALLLVALHAFAAEPPSTGDPFGARPRRAWDVVDVSLDLTVDPAARTLSGTVLEHIVPLGLPDARLRLHQHALAIGEVTVDGAVVTDWKLGADTLDIPVAPGVPHTVTIAWTATPETGVHFRSGRGPAALEAWTQNEDEDGRSWFPGWDYPSDAFPVSIALTVPTGLNAVANGELVSAEPVGPGWTRWRYRIDQPIAGYLVGFAVGEHAIAHVDGIGFPVEIVGPTGVSDAVLRRGADRAPAIGAFLATLLDEPFPYPAYRQVFVQRFLYGGMENAGLTVLSDDLLADEDAVLPHTESVVAHELAHQWFGDLLTCHGWRELWLNEGFATFYAARWAEHEEGDVAYAAQVLSWADGAVDTKTPLSLRDWASTEPAPPYTAEYDRGAIVLHMLRAWLGDAVFDEAVRRYVDAHRFGFVETDDLRQAFEEVTGNDLRWWFDRWVHGWGAPTLATSWQSEPDKLRVTIAQTGTPAWEGPVRVAWGDVDGAHEHDLWLVDGTTTLEVDAHDARWVVVDPVGGLLAHWTRTQPATAWAAALAEAPTAYARLVAVRALGEAHEAADVAAGALATMLAEPAANDRMARAAATALGSLATPAARDALIAALQRPGSASLHADVARALAHFPLDPAVATALEHQLARDEAPTISAAALSALGEAFPFRARRAAETALDHRDPSRVGVLHAAALGVLGHTRAPAVLDTVAARLDDPRRAVQHAAGYAAVDLATGDGVTDARRGKLAVALARWLEHEDLRTRQVAPWLLARLGAPEALPALQAFAAHTTLPDHRDAALRAISTLRARTGPESKDPDAIVKAQVALKEIEAQLEELKKRLEKVERW